MRGKSLAFVAVMTASTIVPGLGTAQDYGPDKTRPGHVNPFDTDIAKIRKPRVPAEEPATWNWPRNRALDTTVGIEIKVISRLPYWEVGKYDSRLSKLCAISQFNQMKPFRYMMAFSGSVGTGALGIAKGNGWNLHDPGNLRDPGADDYFSRDRTGECQVYAWNDTKDRRGKQGAGFMATNGAGGEYAKRNRLRLDGLYDYTSSSN